MKYTKETVKEMINSFFTDYLKRTGLEKLDSNSIQYIEMKKAFMAGTSSMFYQFFPDIGELTDQNQIDHVFDLYNEVMTEFWESEKRRYATRRKNIN